MRNRTIAIAALALAVGTGALAGTAHAQMYGYGMMGPGMMYGQGPGMMYGQGPGMMYGQGPGMMYGWGPGMMGPGMMYGPGYGSGMMGPRSGYGMMYGPGRGWHQNQGNLNISVDEAKRYFERMIAIQGNTRLKVGEVKEKDTDTLVVDIVTKDSSLVQRFLVNRHNGTYQPDEEG